MKNRRTLKTLRYSHLNTGMQGQRGAKLEYSLQITATGTLVCVISSRSTCTRSGTALQHPQCKHLNYVSILSRVWHVRRVHSNSTPILICQLDNQIIAVWQNDILASGVADGGGGVS